MTSPILLTDTVLEGSTSYYDFGLVDASGQGIHGGFLTSLTVSVYDLDTKQPVNSRLHQDILNTNGGTITTDAGPPIVTTVTLEMTPADTAILNASHNVEYRILEFRWTWDAGTKSNSHAVQFGIEGLWSVP